MATKAKKSTKKGAAKKSTKKAASKSRSRKGSAKGTSDFLGSIISIFGRTTPRMSAETRAQLAKGNGISMAVTTNGSFDSLVKELGRRLVIAKDSIRPGGCSPCHSGLDFILIGKERIINPVVEQLQRREFGGG